MKNRLPILSLTYLVLDENGKTIDVLLQTGHNKNNIQWKAEWLVKKKFGSNVTLRLIKSKKES